MVPEPVLDIISVGVFHGGWRIERAPQPAARTEELHTRDRERAYVRAGVCTSGRMYERAYVRAGDASLIGHDTVVQLSQLAMARWGGVGEPHDNPSWSGHL
ncbi:hypothetical protein CCM_03655 [Cordyceps militaris CM01]|uniref:Uncharacterized protein n=1 Tax=Cordyceps militaris (strain CM01) TaxID=983644 RepID=G3JFQ2_CORMM|nr:uncharacterized protein CCM_03655 [Cordyceps militaris CM01]EGX92285.1 hypothetical protein CCM_03655 [Cordyceps militaris CM01]